LSKELIIHASKEGVEIALMEDKRLMELHHDNMESSFSVGDIYLGRVRKLLPGLNAAFIDIDHERDSFLHYHDLGAQVKSLIKFCELIAKGQLQGNALEKFRMEPEIIKTGKIDSVLSANVLLPVQVVKEPISTKGIRLSSQISLSGRYVVLMPFSESLSISKKIKHKEARDRLKQIVLGLRPKHFGVIIRTNAEEATLEDLEKDFSNLMGQWNLMLDNMRAGNKKLYSELDRSMSLMRDMVNDSFTKITVDDQKLYGEITQYLDQAGTPHSDLVKLYKGDKPLFEVMDIERQTRALLNKIVNLGGGAYLIIDHTEAMHVIDVNSGSKRSKQEDQEANALKTNLEAANEIARQLRLRDMGGIVVVDFIDMRNVHNRKALFEHFRDQMMNDRAKHTILPLTKFGLLQITRQRVRQEIVQDIQTPCPVCNGTGSVVENVLIAEDIKHRIENLLDNKTKGTITIHAHPYVFAWFNMGIPNQKMKWFLKYRKRVKVIEHVEYSLNQYEIDVSKADKKVPTQK